MFLYFGNLQLMYPSSLRARLDVLVLEPVNQWSLGDFSLSCNFPMTMTGMFWAVKFSPLDHLSMSAIDTPNFLVCIFQRIVQLPYSSLDVKQCLFQVALKKLN